MQMQQPHSATGTQRCPATTGSGLTSTAGPRWPQGLELHVYDDGRVKIGRKHSVVEVIDVMNRKQGGSNWGSAHVIARFRPGSDQIKIRGKITMARKANQAALAR